MLLEPFDYGLTSLGEEACVSAHVRALTGRTPASSSPEVGHAPSDCYTGCMLDEAQFRHHADHAVEALKQTLIAQEAEGGFEVEENNGALNIVFEEMGGKFVITPNTPVRQIWISALSTSFKLEWQDATAQFVLAKTGESLQPLTARLIQQYLAS